ncbi:hypothetical protein B0J11DRAFT_329908 [Dendryphion nanum]|uniref:Uncharacterized protein n=1 Tax=Dendryphion nanum TaxID=256645 RepID=A0A9P9IM11_9PLEO|nr:hypothetical protein B0J11DRAFT_329908 [Dendryphion nanum]
MSLFPDPNDRHATREPPSATRPPHLNGTVCGCQSGSGCNHELGGDEVGDDHGEGASITSLETLVASNNSEADEIFPPSPDSPEQQFELELFEVQQLSPWEMASFEEIRARFGDSSNRFDRMSRIQQILGLGDDDAPDSLKNEAFESGEHSVVVSEKESIRGMSPGPGIGTWAEGWTGGLNLELGLKKYYFIVSPLRLTPQRRNCRGLVASHLIIGDGASSSELSNSFIEEDFH